ncbi:MAG: PD-(D/E)XK nuclease family protein [Spirochaetia bacterium]|nr:PD-(D/E)XK nuclease family protein [Spirochaetia bacterium]
MDVLKVLAFNNDKTVRETVVSSFLNYFLDPQGDHGLGSELLLEFLEYMQEEVPELKKEVLDSIRSYQKASSTFITVSPEWSGSGEGPSTRRRLDSLISIKHESMAFLIGIEVKLYEGSVSDSEQLSAYAQMLSDYKSEIVDAEELAEDSVYPVLCYLVPSDSSKASSYAKAAKKTCKELGVSGVYVMGWSLVEGFIKHVLDKQNDGSISPADTHAMHILKSLRNAAIKNFRFELPVIRSAAKFPSNSQYEEALGENKLLLDRLRRAIEIDGIKRPLTASPRHTAIGIPAVANPGKGQFNSLCRVVTVDSYEEGNVLEQFVLQIDKGIYEKGFDEIKTTLNAFEGRADITDKDEKGNQYYHPNGKADEPVYRIRFTGPSEDEDTDINGLRTLMKILRKYFPN